MDNQYEYMFVIGDFKPYFDNTKNENIIDIIDTFYEFKKQNTQPTTLVSKVST